MMRNIFLLAIPLFFIGCMKSKQINVDFNKIQDLDIQEVKLLQRCRQIYFDEYTIDGSLTDNWNQNWLNIVGQVLQQNGIKLSFFTGEYFLIEDGIEIRFPFGFHNHFGKVTEITIHEPDFSSEFLTTYELYYDLVSENCKKRIFNNLKTTQARVGEHLIRKLEKKRFFSKTYYVQFIFLSKDKTKLFDFLIEAPYDIYIKL